MTAHRRHLVMLVLLASVALLGAELPAAEHTKDALDVVKKNIADNKAVLVDVREQAEWDEGHLDGAVLVPLSQLKEGKQSNAIPKGRIVYAHCASGKRCLKAAELLEKQGFEVRPLKAGYMDLLKAGFEKAKE
jgi:phage shock protein E